MDAPRTPPPAWSQPDSIGHATSRRLLNASVIAAAPGMPRIRHAGAIGERHLAFVDSLSVAASLRAASSVAADDPRVFRGASRPAMGGMGDGWPTPVVARAVVWPLARSSAGPHAMSQAADTAPGVPGNSGASATLARAVAAPSAEISSALHAMPHAAEGLAPRVAAPSDVPPAPARSVMRSAAGASRSPHGTPEPAAPVAPVVADPPGPSSAPAMPIAPVAVWRRADPAAQGGTPMATAAGGAAWVGEAASPRGPATDGLRVDARANDAMTLAPGPSAGPASPPVVAGFSSGMTPVARAARPPDRDNAPSSAGIVATPGAPPDADGAVRVMPLAVPTDHRGALPLARASASPAGNDPDALAGTAPRPAASVELPGVARSASRDTASEAAPSLPHRAAAPNAAPFPRVAASLRGEAPATIGVDTSGGFARAAAQNAELPLRIPHPVVGQAMTSSGVTDPPTADPRRDHAFSAAAPATTPAVARALATPPDGTRHDPLLPLPTADHAAPGRLSRPAADLPAGPAALAGTPSVMASPATSTAVASRQAASTGLPTVRVSVVPRSVDDTSGGPTLARRWNAPASLATSGVATDVGLPMPRAPQGAAVASRSPAVIPASSAHSPTSVDTPEQAPGPHPEPGQVTLQLPVPTGDAAHRSAVGTPPLVLARAVTGLPGTPGISGIARQAPAAPARAMPLLAHRAASSAEAAAGSPLSIARAGESAASLIDPSADSAAPTTVQHADPVTSSPPTAAAIDVDDLVERACQAVFARLVVEQERRGYARWA